MERKFSDPYWGNQQKTQVICQFHHKDGKTQTASIMDTEDGNPDLKHLFEKFTIEEIDANTAKKLEEDNLNREQKKASEKEQYERMKSDALFAAKLEAFEIEEVKNSKNRELKSKIRKAKTILEVTAFTAAVIVKENE